MDDRNQGVTGNDVAGSMGAQGTSPDPMWGTTTPNMPTATETTTTATSAQPVSQASFQPIDQISTPLTTTVDPAQSQPINQVPVQPMTTMDAASPSGAKKKKTGMIVGVAVAVATLIGGGAYAYVHNMPEKVQYDAVNGLLNADHIQIEGEISAVPADTELSGGINSIKLELKQATANLNYDVDASLKVSAETMGDVSVSLGGAFIEDGTIYIKVGN
ncbi:MAG: hypothetical protein Q4F60_03000, partial [Candidatus Saccharibacteria bacterium]|nr:hypothetical protein [Candidatus Saccharibacteria bacterium]